MHSNIYFFSIKFHEFCIPLYNHKHNENYRISASSSTPHPLVLASLLSASSSSSAPAASLHHRCGFLWPLSWFLQCRADPSTTLLTFLYCRVVSHCAHGPQCNLFIHLPLEDHLDCFQFLIKLLYTYIHIQLFIRVLVFIFLGLMI